ncbi:MAG: hypothetical protein ACRD19_14985 [Terriglobia bacterium]
MPWASIAQARWGHSPAGIRALGGQGNVREWDVASRGKRLPRRSPGGLMRAAKRAQEGKTKNG